MAMPRRSSDSDVILNGEYLDAEPEVKLKLEQVEERLSCPVCLRRFDDPRLLDCCHSFCRECLVDVLTNRLRYPQYPIGAYVMYDPIALSQDRMPPPPTPLPPLNCPPGRVVLGPVVYGMPYPPKLTTCDQRSNDSNFYSNGSNLCSNGSNS